MADLWHHRTCESCRGAGRVWYTTTAPATMGILCMDCRGSGQRQRTPTTADHIADLLALPPADRVARLVALLRAVPDEGPKPWRDGDARCHCTLCDSCGRLYRSEDVNAHRDVCTLRILQRAVSP